MLVQLYPQLSYLVQIGNTELTQGKNVSVSAGWGTDVQAGGLREQERGFTSNTNSALPACHRFVLSLLLPECTFVLLR